MFQVPSDPNHPTYDDATTVTFWQWLTSSGTDRREWRRRRDAATHTTATARTLASVERHAEARVQEGRHAKAALRMERQHAKAAKHAMKAQARYAKQTRKMH